jgi:hypothetical protein
VTLNLLKESDGGLEVGVEACDFVNEAWDCSHEGVDWLGDFGGLAVPGCRLWILLSFLWFHRGFVADDLVEASFAFFRKGCLLGHEMTDSEARMGNGEREGLI